MKKIAIVFIFVFTLVSINACKTTSSCSSIEKQENNTTKTEAMVVVKATT